MSRATQIGQIGGVVALASPMIERRSQSSDTADPIQWILPLDSPVPNEGGIVYLIIVLRRRSKTRMRNLHVRRRICGLEIQRLQEARRLRTAMSDLPKRLPIHVMCCLPSVMLVLEPPRIPYRDTTVLSSGTMRDVRRIHSICMSKAS